MFWHFFSWSQFLCVLEICLLGSGNDWCHYGCYCGLGEKVCRIRYLKNFETLNLKLAHWHFYFILFFRSQHMNLKCTKPVNPQDNIDAICSTHDSCWEAVKNEKNCSYGLWEHYNWDFTDGEV